MFFYKVIKCCGVAVLDKVKKKTKPKNKTLYFFFDVVKKNQQLLNSVKCR